VVSAAAASYPTQVSDCNETVLSAAFILDTYCIYVDTLICIYAMIVSILRGDLFWIVLNTKSGGKTAISSISYAVFLAAMVVTFAPIIGRVPMPALAGLMLTVAFNTFEWGETWHLIKESRHTLQVCAGLSTDVCSVFSLMIALYDQINGF
jgi:Sulfate permease family